MNIVTAIVAAILALQSVAALFAGSYPAALMLKRDKGGDGDKGNKCFNWEEVFHPVHDAILAQCGANPPECKTECDVRFNCVMRVIQASKTDDGGGAHDDAQDDSDALLKKVLSFFVGNVQPWARYMLETEYEKAGSKLDGAFYGRYIMALKTICASEMDHVPEPKCDAECK